MLVAGRVFEEGGGEGGAARKDAERVSGSADGAVWERHDRSELLCHESRALEEPFRGQLPQDPPLVGWQRNGEHLGQYTTPSSADSPSWRRVRKSFGMETPPILSAVQLEGWDTLL